MTLRRQLKNLRSEGAIAFSGIDDPVAAWEELFPHSNPEDVIDALNDASAGEKVRLEIAPADDDGEYSLTLTQGSKRSDNYMKFTMRPEESAYLHDAHFSSQGSGTAKRYLAELVSVFQENNITEMALKAEEIGSYAWAKFGFAPDSSRAWNELKHLLPQGDHVSFKGKDYPLRASERAIIAKVCASDDPQSIWRLTDTLKRPIATDGSKEITVGMAMLINKPWDATLTLDEHDKGFQRFCRYVGLQSPVAERVLS